MADPTLHGNHKRCPECSGARVLRGPNVIAQCHVCLGRGWVPLSDSEIVRLMVAEARRAHWPRRAAASAAE